MTVGMRGPAAAKLVHALLATVLLVGCPVASSAEPGAMADVIDAQSPSGDELAQPSATRAPGAAMPISARSAWQKPITESLAEVTANVVNVTAAEGGGAGFFIDKGRHVLTTVSAVGETPRVMLTLANGFQVVGTVILANGKLNAALIATGPVEVDGLPLLIGIPEVGAPVFAPGATALGRADTEPAVGIISAIRELAGLRMIQSTIASVPGFGGGPLLDAHGNVVGMATPALAAEDGTPDMSFFLPVEDALDGLGVLVEPPESPAPAVAPADIREARAGTPLDLKTAEGPDGQP